MRQAIDVLGCERNVNWNKFHLQNTLMNLSLNDVSYRLSLKWVYLYVVETHIF